MEFNLKDRRFLVTGATKGIGRSITKALVECGAEVFALGRDEQQLKELELEHPDKIHVLKVDLSDWSATRDALQNLPVMHGVVNNAAILEQCPCLDASRESVGRIFDVNMYGALNVSQIVGKKMVEAENGGSIVNVSGIVSLKAYPNLLAYSMSKAALNAMTRQFAVELGHHNIRVNSICPTAVSTNLTRNAGILCKEPGEKDIFSKLAPLGRIAQADEVAKSVLYLLSDNSTMVTGTVHEVDGGLTNSIGVAM